MTTTTKCDNCNKQVPMDTFQAEGYPDKGLEIFPLTFGYYSGFLDNFPTDMDKPAGDRVMFCHDCSASLFRHFPSLLKGLDLAVSNAEGEHEGYGLHPCEGDTPCCEFAWQSNGDEGTLLLADTETKNWKVVALPKQV